MVARDHDRLFSSFDVRLTLCAYINNNVNKDWAASSRHLKVEKDSECVWIAPSTLPTSIRPVSQGLTPNFYPPLKPCRLWVIMIINLPHLFLGRPLVGLKPAHAHEKSVLAMQPSFSHRQVA